MTARTETQVVIVGGGPVGLLLACALLDRGIACRVIERSDTVSDHSRSIGIQPLSLEVFEQLGFADAFVAAGVPVRRAHAFSGTRLLGSLSLADECPPPFNFVLALPQHDTERLLEQQLARREASALTRQVELVGLSQDPRGVTARVRELAADRTRELRCRLLVGCDGKRSTVRRLLEVPFDGGPYPDTYLMGDFSETTPLGDEAALFWHEGGVIESFPLPGARRRWVARTRRLLARPSRADLERRVRRAIDHDLRPADNTMLSPFGVQHHLARRTVVHRVALAGDAAHVVSPIGGQGMNLGWRDAWQLARAIDRIENRGAELPGALSRYQADARRAARKVTRRAALNMMMGRPSSVPELRRALITALVRTRARRWLALMFTMRGLDSWPL